jgi:hypothetical protein
MAQVKLLKISSEGIPQEFDQVTDEITLASFTVQGGGPVLSGTGLDMNGQNITDVPEVHGSASLLLEADGGEVELQSSTSIVRVLDGSAVSQLEFQVTGGNAVISSQVGYVMIASAADTIELADSAATTQLQVDMSGGNARLASPTGGLFLESSTSTITLNDSSSAAQGYFDTAGTALKIGSSVGGLTLQSATDAFGLNDNLGNNFASMSLSSGGLEISAFGGPVILASGGDYFQFKDSLGASQFEIGVAGTQAILSSVVGDILSQSATNLFKFADSTSVDQGQLDVSGSVFSIESLVGELRLQSASDQIGFYDSAASAFASMSKNGGDAQLQSEIGDLNLAGSTNIINFRDNTSVDKGSVDVSTDFKFEALVGDIVLVAASNNIDASNQDLKIANIVFDDPAVGTINQTAGIVAIDDLMAKERDNVVTSAGSVIFSSITDVAGEVDGFRLPYLAGVPSATPTFDANPGYMVYDSTNKNLYIWDGTAWDNQSTVSSAQSLDLTFTAGEALTAGDAVYISSAGLAFKADNDSGGASEAIGFALTSVASAASVQVRVGGKVSGLTGLTAGARYYIGESGAITSTVPSASGEYIVQMGYAVSATEVVVQVLQLGRRA